MVPHESPLPLGADGQCQAEAGRVCHLHAQLGPFPSMVQEQFGLVRFVQLDLAEDTEESAGDDHGPEKWQGVDEQGISAAVPESAIAQERA